VVAGLIGGANYALAVARAAALPVLLIVTVTATLTIAWRYSHKAALILYVAWLGANAVVGVMSGDQETTEALWGIGLLGLILLLVTVVMRRKQRRAASPPPAPGRLPG
jgi:predicted branched-subunit amino acid permease